MKIGFFGGGKMAEGIISALLAERVVPNAPRDSAGRSVNGPYHALSIQHHAPRTTHQAPIIVAERVAERAAALKATYRVRVTDDVRRVASEAEMLFLAVRPQDVDAVAAAVKPLLTKEQTLVSIVAGKTLAKLRRAFGAKVRLVRVMPNLALRVGEGMCAVCGKDAAAVADLLGAAGRAVILKEKDFDAVTALSGSGPAYFAYMEAAMMEGGVALGLKPAVARLLAEQTMYGTAKFLRETGADLNAFIAGVATKGGTTAAGLVELEKGGAFKRLVAATLAAAANRSRELA